MSMVSFATSTIVAGCLALFAVCPAVAEDKILFDFAEPSSVHDWVPVKLPELQADQPAPKVEIVPSGDTPESGKCLKIRFDGGDWPAISTTKIPVAGNWKPYETLKADLTVERSAPGTSPKQSSSGSTASTPTTDSFSTAIPTTTCGCTLPASKTSNSAPRSWSCTMCPSLSSLERMRSTRPR